MYYFRQQVDNTYILQVYKDNKKLDVTKTTIVMDLCDKVVRVNMFTILIIKQITFSFLDIFMAVLINIYFRIVKKDDSVLNYECLILKKSTC